MTDVKVLAYHAGTDCRLNLLSPGICSHCNDWNMTNKFSFFFELSYLFCACQTIHDGLFMNVSVVCCQLTERNGVPFLGP